MFQPVDSRVSFPQLEEGVLQFWRDKNIFQKSVDNRQGAPLFILYEGPPTANASPGIHFAMPPVLRMLSPATRQ